MISLMKAIVKTKPQRGAELLDVPVPKPGEGQVLIKVRATSICGTDLHIYQWNEWADKRLRKLLPQIMGHEVAGEVVELGPGVKHIKVGDFISAETHVPCGHCYECLTGNMHICLNMKIFGVDMNGVFAEYAVVPEVDAWVNPPDLPPAWASIQEPLGNATDTVLAEDIAGKTTLITGAGPLGLLTIAVARASGATKIIVSEPVEYRRKKAMEMGADVVVDPTKEDVVEVVKRETGGLGVEVFLELSGKESAIHQGFSALVPGGRASLLGLPDGPVTMDLNNEIIFKGIRVYGITGRKMFSTWFKVSHLLSSGRLDPSPAITHEFRLEEFQKGFELMEKGETGKVILYP
ncbi:MAG: L-threonine 3-dehydrogenase [candidate division WOR-3 bacterium]